MRIKTNLPKAIVYREAGAEGAAPSVSFRPTALPSSDDFIKVVYEGGHFVAIGKNGGIAYSKEGQTWTYRKLGEYAFCDIDYIDGLYIIVGGAGAKGLILSSADLSEWKKEAETDLGGAKDSYGHAYSLLFRGIWNNGRDYIVMAIAYTSNYSIQYAYTGASVRGLKQVLIEDGIERYPAGQYASASQILKGNNRVGIARQLTGKGKIWYTSDGNDFDSVELTSGSAVPGGGSPIFFYEGYFQQGIAYRKAAGGGNYATFAHMYRSISLKQWEAVGPGLQHNTGKELPYFICALRVGDRSLYIGEHSGLLVGEESIVEKAPEECFPISPSVTVNSAARSEARIVCVGDGGVVFWANADGSDKNMEIAPATVDQEIYIRKSDNVRMLHVKAVTSGIDSNIRPENIRKDVTILGVKGTYGG